MQLGKAALRHYYSDSLLRPLKRLSSEPDDRRAKRLQQPTRMTPAADQNSPGRPFLPARSIPTNQFTDRTLV